MPVKLRFAAFAGSSTQLGVVFALEFIADPLDLCHGLHEFLLGTVRSHIRHNGIVLVLQGSDLGSIGRIVV